MSQWNLCCGRSAHSGSDAGDDLEWDVGPAQRFDFFATSAEDEGVSALQADDAQSGIGEGYHQKIDFFLYDLFLSAALADVMHLSLHRNEFQDFGSNQVVVQNGIGRAQDTQRLQGEQFRVARSRAHKVDFSRHTLGRHILSRHAPSAFAASSSVSGISAKAASSASLLASECSRSSLRSLSRSLARMSLRVSPSSATHAA